MTIQRIQFDNVFFSAMIDKLYSFYTTHIIPVLCESDNDLNNDHKQPRIRKLSGPDVSC